MLVSIIVPTFNSEKYLKNCIESILSQSYKNFEVIFVDNSSKDKTVQIVKDYIKQNKNFVLKIVNNEFNIANSRNIGIQNAKGDLIAFLDSDDYWYPKKLEKCLKFFQEYDFIYHDVDLIENYSGKKIKSYKRYQISKMYELLFRNNPIATSSVIIRKKILDKNKFSEEKKFRTIEDFELWLRIINNKIKFKFIQSKLGCLVERPNSISSIKVNKIHGFKIIFLKYLKYMNQEEKLKSYAYLKYRFGNIIFEKNKKRSFKFYLYTIKNNKINFDIKIKSIIKIIKIFFS